MRGLYHTPSVVIRNLQDEIDMYIYMRMYSFTHTLKRHNKVG